jgi:imidazolonepropionase-like amidohydrolase
MRFAHVPARDRDMDDEFAALVRQRRNLMLVPNLPARGVPTDLSWLSASIPAAELQKIQAGNRENAEQQKAFGIQGRNLVRLSKEGVSVAMGTDGNTPWAAHVEMEDMVAAGLTPAQVITAATKNGADYLRIADLGTIEQNKSADFIVLDAKSARRHPQHAEDQCRLRARCAGSTRGAGREVDGPGDELTAPITRTALRGREPVFSLHRARFK